jgi:kinesin family protein 5
VGKKLVVRSDKTSGTCIDGLVECYVSSEDEFQNLIRIGANNRKIDRTNMNDLSSRSHLIIIIQVKQNNTKSNVCKIGKLNLVDLAGSERVGRTGASGLTLEESKNINKSLSALGNVINALFEKQAFIPYRSSKLTKVLQESVGGNNLTSLIVTCSTAVINEGDTLSTLRFGNRAKAVQNQPKINQEITVEQYKLILAKLDEKFTGLQGYAEQLESVLRKNKIPEPSWAEKSSHLDPQGERKNILDHTTDSEFLGNIYEDSDLQSPKHTQRILELEAQHEILVTSEDKLLSKIKSLEATLLTNQEDYRTILTRHSD